MQVQVQMQERREILAGQEKGEEEDLSRPGEEREEGDLSRPWEEGDSSQPGEKINKMFDKVKV